jgi:hypothetical protein
MTTTEALTMPGIPTEHLAEVAGSDPPGSPWAERDAEPFQAPAV